jgi:hypothetical protein
VRESFKKIRIFKDTLALKRTQALLFGAVLVVFLGTSNHSQAADFLQRSVTIDSSIASETTRHTFEMRTVTAGPIGSFVFEYCTNNPFIGTSCVAPAGLDVDSVSLDGQSGITGFSVNGANTTDNRIVISRTVGATSPVDTTYVFSNVVNPSTVNQTVYVRISSHASTNGSGPVTDSGAVVFATVTGIGIGGYVPPYLTFCVGVTVNFGCQGGGQGFLEAFGEFTSSSASTVTTQFGAATNDPTGYNVFMNGQTLTSGNEIITPLASTTASTPGTSQFGINLVSNTNPSVGSNVGGPGVGAPTANYRQQNRFRFVNGERIASAPLPAAFNRYTVTYVVNVSEEQAPGIYSSTLTYTAIASF